MAAKKTKDRQTPSSKLPCRRRAWPGSRLARASARVGIKSAPVPHASKWSRS